MTGPSPMLAEGVLAELVQAHVERHEDVVLGLEVVVEGRLGDAQLLGDLPQAGAVEALLDEEVERHIEDALAGVLGGRGGGSGGVGRWRAGWVAGAVEVAAWSAWAASGGGSSSSGGCSGVGLAPDR